MKPCRNGQHSFIVITKHGCVYQTEEVVRWCEYCGSIVVDLDSDGRTMAGYYRSIQNPQIMKDLQR